MQITNSNLAMNVLLVLILTLSGCGTSDGPKLATVSGTVVLDGSPLAGASISFVIPEGSSSSAVTDKNGHYELEYNAKQKGAMIGTHTVKITTETDEYKDTDGDGELDRVIIPERLPAKYNSNTELTAEVKAGENTIDFALTSHTKFN